MLNGLTQIANCFTISLFLIYVKSIYIIFWNSLKEANAFFKPEERSKFVIQIIGYMNLVLLW